MITRPTVLILGAGASAPYDFPTGRQLVIQITTDLEPNRNSQLRANLQFSDEETFEFRDELSESNQPSVDAFIESRPQFVAIGKAAIAIKISHENREGLRRTTHEMRWYEYLWHQLGTTKREFLDSKLSVITFNYDRSLEYSLFYSLLRSFGGSVEEAAENLRSRIPIIHVYGQLGAPDFFDKDGRPYNNNMDATALAKAIAGIEIIHESEAVPPGPADEIERRLSNADVVCFLGFGYNKTNVDRLNIEIFKVKGFFGSAFGLAATESAKAAGLFDRHIQLGPPNSDILEFVRDFPIFA